MYGFTRRSTLYSYSTQPLRVLLLCSYLNVLETRRACVWDLHLDSISTQLTVSVLFDSADVAVLLEAGAELLVHVELLFGG